LQLDFTYLHYNVHLEYNFSNYLQELMLTDQANKYLSFRGLPPLAPVLFKEVELNADGPSAAEGTALGALEG
jgi:hypothetical protein